MRTIDQDLMINKIGASSNNYFSWYNKIQLKYLEIQ